MFPRVLIVALLVALGSVSPKALAFQGVDTDSKARFPGPTERGFLLPNGWTISPAGDQVTLTDLPLNIIPLADGKHALAASSGFNDHELVLVDLTSKMVVAKQTVPESWFGLAVDEKTGQVLWSGGGGDVVHTFNVKDGSLEATGDLELSPKKPASESIPFRSGLALDAREGTRTLYSLDANLGTITRLPLNDPKTTRPEGKPAKVATRPYDVVLDRHGRRLYVSDWAKREVVVINPSDLQVVARIAVGEHPNQMVIHPKDDRLFVACASENCVSVIDTLRGIVTERISTALFPLAPEGSTPDALVISPDGETLYVANADNNCVAVIDIETPNRSQVKGFIPTGWYPTSIAMTPDGRTLLVGVGKGNQTRANPIGAPKAMIPRDERRSKFPFPYIGTTLSGALSIIPVPDDAKLASYTTTVFNNCPYSDKLLTVAPSARKTAIPTRVGDPSPIKHIIYIIKENRTYDQVLGDLPRGNGDPSLVMFGEEVTPNHHKLAREFVQLDNLYCNGHVSKDGHPWSTMAYNTDYIARNWSLGYSHRAEIEDDEEGDLANAPSGYLWDACARAGLTYRSYGECGHRVSQPDGSMKVEAQVLGLVGHICPTYVKGIKNARDSDRADIFLKEFEAFVKAGTLPRFIVMSLGEDHTTGTTPGTFTPSACVASNDLALGRIVEAVTKSKIWPESAIFVIEDDAQNGPDHVDAHRTVGLVISPYIRRGALDSTQYSTASMIRTMELVLGLPPLSQYDAAATPMFASFTDTPDLRPYSALGSRIDLNARNTAVAYGAERSKGMDFSEFDRIDDFDLNEILWHAVKGQDAPMPPAVRRAIAQRVAVPKL